MPSVNLRLSDEQHAELVKAGQLENRSLQREIIHRLFRTESTVRHVRTQQVGVPATNADSEDRGVRARTIEPGEVKSDFKPERKRK